MNMQIADRHLAQTVCTFWPQGLNACQAPTWTVSLCTQVLIAQVIFI